MITFNLKRWLQTRRRQRMIAALRALADGNARASRHAKTDSHSVLVISHDAYPAGAQRLLLTLLAEWKRRASMSVKVICVESGALRGEFESLFPTLVLSDYLSERDKHQALLQFVRNRFDIIYSNSVVNGPILDLLRTLGVPIITHCHELQAAIERWAPDQIMTDTLTNSDYIIAACESIARNLRIRHQVPAARLGTVYAFIDFWDAIDAPNETECVQLREELGVLPVEILVLGCGTTDWRKGPDLFIAAAIVACKQDPKLKFIWIGGEPSQQLSETIAANGLVGRIRFIGKRPHARRYFYAGDIFALTSREDPCALVALEAANAGLPVVCFDGAGDIPEVLGPDCGAVVPFESSTDFASALVHLAANSALRRRAGTAGRERIRMNHSTSSAALAIEKTLDFTLQLPRKTLGRTRDSPLVSVIVPNYNHKRFLTQRLASLSAQSIRNVEVILLDDASSDGSRELLDAFVARDRRARLLCNDNNSGSTFKQWRKGLSSAQGKYIWIAESDDYADLTFLDTTVTQLERDSGVVLAQTHSIMIDIDGKRLGRPNDWLNDLAKGRWDTSFVSSGIDEVRHFLLRKNTIPNASACVFRNFPGVEYLVDDTMRLCADWLFWIRLLARGKYAFSARDLNFWRQQSSNARTRPPGVLEWEEGQRVLAEASAVVGLTPAAQTEVIDAFRRKCSEWSSGQFV